MSPARRNAPRPRHDRVREALIELMALRQPPCPREGQWLAATTAAPELFALRFQRSGRGDLTNRRVTDLYGMLLSVYS